MFKIRFFPSTSVLIHEREFWRQFFWQQNFCWHFMSFSSLSACQWQFWRQLFKANFQIWGKVIYCSFFFFFQMVESGIYVHLGSLVLLSCREGWRGWLYYILTESFNVASVALKRRLVSSVLELRLSLESLLSNNSGEVMLLWFPQWRFSQVPWAFIVMRCVQTWCFRKLFDIVWNWLVVSLVFRHGQAVWINLIFLSNDV